MRWSWILVVALAGCYASTSDDAPPPAACGNGVVDTGETCDDGNALSGDGCSAACADEGNPHLTVGWALKNAASNMTRACPNTYDTVAIYTQSLDAAGNDTGSGTVDLFDCAQGTATIISLPAGFYRVWVEIVNHSNTVTYAVSLSASVDMSVTGKQVDFQLLDDGGYFEVRWELVGATSNTPLTCAQAAAAGGVELLSASSDRFDCEAHHGFSAGLPAGTYTVTLSALGGGDQTLGTSNVMTSTIMTRNEVTDLGTIEIPISGL